MIVGQLSHVAIRSGNLEITRRFYTEVLGMRVAERPDFGFPGLWIRSGMFGGEPFLHFYGGSAAEDPDGTVPEGTAAIDHVSIATHGYREVLQRLRRFRLEWWENVVPELSLWQVFVYDPNHVLLEISFNGGRRRRRQAEYPGSPPVPARQADLPSGAICAVRACFGRQEKVRGTPSRRKLTRARGNATATAAATA